MASPDCTRCGATYDLGDREPASHGMCWPCASEALDEILAERLQPAPPTVDGPLRVAEVDEANRRIVLERDPNREQ